VGHQSPLGPVSHSPHSAAVEEGRAAAGRLMAPEEEEEERQQSGQWERLGRQGPVAMEATQPSRGQHRGTR